MPGKKPTHTGRDATKEATGIKHEISIHAPHTGRDVTRTRRSPLANHFNPRAPYGARRHYGAVHAVRHGDFNPRAPYGARLAPDSRRLAIVAHFNPRAPYGARHSVYAPKLRKYQHFNPRAPYGARLPVRQKGPGSIVISIHAPHTGRDGVVFAHITEDD